MPSSGPWRVPLLVAPVMTRDPGRRFTRPLSFRSRGSILGGGVTRAPEASMKRFLPPRELARDLRFKRAQSKNVLFRTLPDDVVGIVRVLEEVGPKLRERVAGTALEAVFDDLGPGF